VLKAAVNLMHHYCGMNSRYQQAESKLADNGRVQVAGVTFDSVVLIDIFVIFSATTGRGIAQSGPHKSDTYTVASPARCDAGFTFDLTTGRISRYILSILLQNKTTHRIKENATQNLTLINQQNTKQAQQLSTRTAIRL